MGRFFVWCHQGVEINGTEMAVGELDESEAGGALYLTKVQLYTINLQVRLSAFYRP